MNDIACIMLFMKLSNSFAILLMKLNKTTFIFSDGIRKDHDVGIGIS